MRSRFARNRSRYPGMKEFSPAWSRILFCINREMKLSARTYSLRKAFNLRAKLGADGARHAPPAVSCTPSQILARSGSPPTFGDETPRELSRIQVRNAGVNAFDGPMSAVLTNYSLRVARVGLPFRGLVAESR